MKSPAPTQEQIAHLRHELLTPINHILGFTEIQIEEAPDTGLADCVPALGEIHEGGRSLLALIEYELDPGSCRSDLTRLGTRIEAEAGPGLGLAKKLAEELHEMGRESVASEVELVATAFESLLSLSRQMLVKK